MLQHFYPPHHIPRQAWPCNTGSVEWLELLLTRRGASATERYTGISGLRPWLCRSLPQFTFLNRSKLWHGNFMSKMLLLHVICTLQRYAGPASLTKSHAAYTMTCFSICISSTARLGGSLVLCPPNRRQAVQTVSLLLCNCFACILFAGCA